MSKPREKVDPKDAGEVRMRVDRKRFSHPGDVLVVFASDLESVCYVQDYSTECPDSV